MAANFLDLNPSGWLTLVFSKLSLIVGINLFINRIVQLCSMLNLNASDMTSSIGANLYPNYLFAYKIVIKQWLK
jgi:hypothetical protein